MELMKLLLHGDCLEKLKVLKDNSIDSIVTDPPYGISFMSKKWDYDVPSVEIWTECLRVLKPGGHLLSFSGSRTYHRMAVRIEDAGFEIRDQIMWIYGSGFPKSHNIGKAVDKLQGNEREVIGLKHPQYKDGVPGGKGFHNSLGRDGGERLEPEMETKGQSEWEGWGTALKPAHEPIVVARKPLSEKSVAENVLKWGTGGINIDENRIGYKDENDKQKNTDGLKRFTEYRDKLKDLGYGFNGGETYNTNTEGRWPANIILDEEAGQVLDEQSGVTIGNKPGGIRKGKSDFVSNFETEQSERTGYNDKGGASRFFYCPKTSKKDRDEGLDKFPDYKKYEDTCSDNHSFSHITPKNTLVKNSHPTVKPTSLMEYLIKLVTPVGGTVLDPFMGSGSTGKASVRNGFDFIGIEREEEYIKIAEARIKNELNG